MQLGARWRAGDPPHRSVPALLNAQIAAEEALRPTAQAWTLTWLEGRPRCVLDDAVVVTLDPGGKVVVGDLGTAAEAEDDDWLR